MPVVSRLVDESEMIGHGVPSVRASKRVVCVWKKDAKKKGDFAEMRRGWDRLGVVEHVFRQLQASHPDVVVRFLLGRMLGYLEFQDVTL